MRRGMRWPYAPDRYTAIPPVMPAHVVSETVIGQWRSSQLTYWQTVHGRLERGPVPDILEDLHPGRLDYEEEPIYTVDIVSHEQSEHALQTYLHE